MLKLNRAEILQFGEELSFHLVSICGGQVPKCCVGCDGICADRSDRWTSSFALQRGASGIRDGPDAARAPIELAQLDKMLTHPLNEVPSG
jgi:hypothetical protein